MILAETGSDRQRTASGPDAVDGVPRVGDRRGAILQAVRGLPVETTAASSLSVVSGRRPSSPGRAERHDPDLPMAQRDRALQAI